MESDNTPQLKKTKTHISKQSFCLPSEIIEEILSRLPVKSLLKFRCVSKPWRSLIGSKRFIKKQLDNSTKNPSFAHHWIIINSIEPHRGLSQCSLRSMLDDPFTHQFQFCDLLNAGDGSIRIVGCCNGLVCILVSAKHFILWNPSTRMTKKLPAIDRKIKHGHVTSCGFGFDEMSGDYKVFGLLSAFWVTTGYEATSKVYSLETNLWKLVKNGDFSPFSEAGKFASGKLHWLRAKGSHSDIASFDLRSEVYSVVELPSYPGGDCVVSMDVLEGCLSILCENNECSIDLWIMKQYGVRESWDKVVTFPQLNHVEISAPFSALFALGPNGKILLTYGSTFVIHYPEDNGYRHCQVQNVAAFRGADIYVESLVSLIPYGEQEAERVE